LIERTPVMSIPFGAHIPFVAHLGITLESFDEGVSVLHYPVRPEHLNSFDVTHGGAVMTFMDVVMAAAARSVDKDKGVVTIEMKTSFMRAAQVLPGQHLIGHGRLLHRTRQLAFTEGRILDPQGQLCAHATATFKYVDRRALAAPATD